MRTGRKKGRTSCPRHRRGHQQNQKHIEEQGGGETLLSAGGVRSSREWGKMQTDRQTVCLVLGALGKELSDHLKD